MVTLLVFLCSSVWGVLVGSCNLRASIPKCMGFIFSGISHGIRYFFHLFSLFLDALRTDLKHRGGNLIWVDMYECFHFIPLCCYAMEVHVF